jgi:hypothetical protein
MRKPRNDKDKPRARSGKVKVGYFIAVEARDKLKRYSEAMGIPQGVIVEGLIDNEISE